MKKIIAMIMMTCMSVSLVACAGNSTDDASVANEAAEGIEEVTEAADEAETEAVETAEPEEAADIPEINLDNPADEIRNMISLMDALNIACVETPGEYDGSNPEYVWHALHVALCNSDFRGMTFEEDEVYRCVPAAFVEDIFHAMFADVDEMPDIPEEYVEGDYPSMKVDGDDYYFMLGDRGLSDFKAYDYTTYESGDVILSVLLYSPEYDLNEEIYSGDYWMIANSDPDSFFKYEIYAGGPANEFSDNKIKGGVSIGYYMYDDGSYYEPGEAKSNMRVDIPYFTCLDDSKTGVQELNMRILDELYVMTDDLYTDYNYDVTWLEIYTNRYYSDEYVQAVTSAIEYPDYATEGVIYTYNYDVLNEKAMTKQDGLDLTGLTEQKLYASIKEHYKPEFDADVYDHSEYRGFAVLDDGNVDYYFMIYIDNELADPRNELMVYHSKDGSIGKYTK